MDKFVRTGELAKAAGVLKSTIDYYAREGFLPHRTMKHGTNVQRPYREFQLHTSLARIKILQKAARKPSLREVVKRLK